MVDEALFNELVATADRLAAVVDQYEAVKEPPDPWDDMVLEPKRQLQEVLMKWYLRHPRADGSNPLEFREEELEVGYFYAPGQNQAREEARGVKVTHNATGLSAESYASGSQLDNWAAAVKALRGMVARKFSN